MKVDIILESLPKALRDRQLY